MNHKFGIALAGLTLGAAAFAQTKWDLPTAYPASNFHTENITQFANDVDKGSGGKLKITVHANASLFKAPEIKRAVQGGQAQLGEILLVNYQNEWQMFGADGIPFLADSYDAAWKLYQAQKPVLEKKLAEQGIALLYTVAWPPQGIFVKKEIASAADLKGVKWRAYSPATARIGELVGAQPVTVQQAELSQAMATGVIESYMSSGSTGYDTKTYEYIKNFYDTQAWLPKNAVLMNKKAFDALDKPTQDAVLKAAGRCREARMGAVEEEEPRVPRPAQEERHDGACALGTAQDRHEEGRRHHDQGVDRKGRHRGPVRRRRLQEDVSRIRTAPDAKDA
jgi:TRAP-type C4-dicarboxylate transport system substrate-binding protein